MTTLPSYRYFLYARKSTDNEERQVRSIHDQIAELEDLAKREGHVIVKTFTESKTAKRPGRPVFNEMLQALARGEADGILAWHPDRLARNSLDGGQIIYLLDIGTIKTLKFCTMAFDPSSQGKFMLAIAFGQSKYYVDNLGENIRRGKRQKIKSGLWPQMAPLGYINDRATRGIAIDQQKARLIREAFELYALGRHSLADLRELLRQGGLVGTKNKPLGIQNVQYILQNPIYCGVMRYSGELYDGNHEPIVSRELFEKVQQTMKLRRKRSRKQRKYFALRGFMTCKDCGTVYTAELQKGHNYYRCTKRRGKCSQPYVREEELSRQMSEHLKRFGIPAHWVSASVRELEIEKNSSQEAAAEAKRELLRDCDSLDTKIARLTDAYASNALTLDEFRAHKNAMVEEKQRIRERIVMAEEGKLAWFEPAVDFINRCGRTLKTAEEGTIEEKRHLCETIGSNFFVAARQLSFDPKPEWKTLVPQPFLPNPDSLAPSSAEQFAPKSSDWMLWR